MRTFRIKICGLCDPNNIREVAECNPDFMGFIFYKPSPRFCGETFTIPEDINPTVKRVGVFVNESFEEIFKIVKKYNLDYVQLHGNESPHLCSALKSLGIHVIKVFSVDDHFHFNEVNPYKKYVDYLMFDTKGKYYGGNATPFNWKVLERYDQEVPFFLSGGITPSMIDSIYVLKSMNLYAIDVNSGVEVQPGFKNIDKVRQLMELLE